MCNLDAEYHSFLRVRVGWRVICWLSQLNSECECELLNKALPSCKPGAHNLLNYGEYGSEGINSIRLLKVQKVGESEYM
jgi:hypothetical protein